VQKIEYRKGDLLETDITHILHGCNAVGVMGSGVAAAIRQKYPKAYVDYMDIYNSHGLTLGGVSASNQPDGKVILNAITQPTIGRTGIHVSYWAIANVFRCLNALIRDKMVALPMIGAGLGGGDWNVIEAIIENTAKTYQPVVYQL
jgi:O-acetyl-ADP-ribose deacetylase (regulator of RNase III)